MPTILAKDETKRRRMVKTPTNVLFAREWIIFPVSVCKAAGKSFHTGSKEEIREERLNAVNDAD